MADLDDFFAKKDKKKKGKKGSKFAKANTDILAQNLIENDKKTEDDEKRQQQCWLLVKQTELEPLRIIQG